MRGYFIKSKEITTNKSPKDALQNSIIDPALLAALRQMRGDDITPPHSPLHWPISAAIRMAREESGRKIYRPGERVEYQGIYLGLYHPKNNNGSSLNKTFNVFAAPEDLVAPTTKEACFTYYDTRIYTLALENWHGFDGSDYIDQTELNAALEDGLYKGTWIIPPLEILSGFDAYGWLLADQTSLYQHRHTEAFDNTFNISTGIITTDITDYYWSCSRVQNNPGRQWATRFYDGACFAPANIDKTESLRCRLVRLVEMPST